MNNTIISNMLSYDELLHMSGILFHRRHSRRSLSLDILTMIGNAVEALAQARTFRDAVNEFIRMRRIPEHRRSQTYNNMLYLRRRGYIHFKPFLKPTLKGKEFLSVGELLNLKLPRPVKWDGKWRMVIFDVPNEKNDMRLAFKDKIKSLGFRMVQRSVWVYPYECGREIDRLRTFYRIRDYVTYAIVQEIEDNASLRKLFNM